MPPSLIFQQSFYIQSQSNAPNFSQFEEKKSNKLLLNKGNIWNLCRSFRFGGRRNIHPLHWNSHDALALRMRGHNGVSKNVRAWNFLFNTFSHDFYCKTQKSFRRFFHSEAKIDWKVIDTALNLMSLLLNGKFLPGIYSFVRIWQMKAKIARKRLLNLSCDALYAEKKRTICPDLCNPSELMVWLEAEHFTSRCFETFEAKLGIRINKKFMSSLEINPITLITREIKYWFYEFPS